MEPKYYTTPNGLNLLTEWDGENHNPEIYAANVARARAAVYRFRNRGGLIFGGSRMPRTNAEFFKICRTPHRAILRRFGRIANIR